MPGLSESKRQSRRERILNAARATFGQWGFEAASMAAIAALADVGVGTLYNYFPSKGDLLLGLVATRTVDYAAEMDAVLAQPSMAPLAKAEALAAVYLKSFGAFNKRIWREFLSFALASRPELFLQVRRVDAVFVDRLAALVPRGTAELLYSAWIYRLVSYTADEGAPSSGLLAAFREDCRAVTPGGAD